MRIRLLPLVVVGSILAGNFSSQSPQGVDGFVAGREAPQLAATTSPVRGWAKGLMSRDGFPPVSVTYVDNAVVHVHWKDLEKTDQEFNFAGNAWGQVAEARARGLKVRLRFYAGIHAPAFVKAIHPADKPFAMSEPDPDNDPATNDGIDCSVTGGIAVTNPITSAGGCVPYFWTTPVLDQYQQLMREVARRYDTTAEGDHVLEAVASACSTVYAEPFYRAHRDLRSNHRLWAAGLNETTDMACHRRAMQIHNTELVNIRTSLAVSPWEVVDGSSDDGLNRDNSWAKAESFANSARTTMGSKLVIQNNGLGENEGCPNRLGDNVGGPQFCYISSLAQPVGFQTETFAALGGDLDCAKGIAGLYGAIDNGLATKASFVELPYVPSACGGLTGLDQARLAAADRALEANAGTSSPAPTTSSTVPGAPTQVAATRGDAKATVTWAAPASNGGSAITGYTVTASPGGTTASAGSSATAASVSGLTNGTSYTFTVRATNALGSSVASAPSNAVTPATVPGAPTSVSAIGGDASATVRWATPASNGGSPITGYTVTASPGGKTASAGASATSASVSGLTNGTSYTFTVRATNALGSSVQSPSSKPVVPQRPRDQDNSSLGGLLFG